MNTEDDKSIFIFAIIDLLICTFAMTIGIDTHNKHGLFAFSLLTNIIRASAIYTVCWMSYITLEGLGLHSKTGLMISFIITYLAITAFYAFTKSGVDTFDEYIFYYKEYFWLYFFSPLASATILIAYLAFKNRFKAQAMTTNF